MCRHCFRPLPRETLESLSGQMTLRSFARRAMVMSKDSPAQELGFLVDGRLQGVDFTVDGRSVGLYFVDPGDYFGELSVVDGQAPSEYVVAAVKSTVAFLESRMARQLILNHPDLARDWRNACDRSWPNERCSAYPTPSSGCACCYYNYPDTLQMRACR